MKNIKALLGLAACFVVAFVLGITIAREPAPSADPGLEALDSAASIAEPDQSMVSDGSASRSASAGPASNSMPSMQEVRIMDAAGFGQPMVSATVQIPTGWVTQGGVGWDRSSDCVTNHLRFQWLAGSPDGEQVFEAMPGYNWQVQGTEIQMNPCPALAIRSAREFLQMVSQRYPNAQIIEYRDRPDLVPPSPEQQGNGAKARTEVGQLAIGYTIGGREMRALLTTTLNLSELQGNIVGGVSTVFAQRAPKGRLNGMIGERIMRSLKVDPRWGEMTQQTMAAAIETVSRRQREGIERWHAGRMADINARGEMERSQIRMNANREVAQIYSNTWANTQSTNDNIHRRTLEGIGSYNTYADPRGGGVVRESIDYSRVLRTENGDYISTNDPYLNPAGSEQLEQVR